MQAEKKEMHLKGFEPLTTQLRKLLLYPLSYKCIDVILQHFSGMCKCFLHIVMQKLVVAFLSLLCYDRNVPYPEIQEENICNFI